MTGAPIARFAADSPVSDAADANPSWNGSLENSTFAEAKDEWRSRVEDRETAD